MTLLETIVIILIILVTLSIIWSTLQTGISPVMSSKKASKAMLDSIKAPENGTLVDLGSGWGTLIIAVARKYPDKQVIGYELSWVPWMISVIRKYTLGLNNLTLYRKDFKKANLSNASILLCYLFPRGMFDLHKKLKKELSHEVMVVSNTFALPSCKPTKTIRLKDLYQTPVYTYHWQPKFKKTNLHFPLANKTCI